jgi:hypothetical protein
MLSDMIISGIKKSIMKKDGGNDRDLLQRVF